MLSPLLPKSGSLRETVAVRRVRQILSIALASTLVFVGINSWVVPAELTTPTVYTLVQLAVISGGLVLLWRHPSLRVASRVGEIAMIVIIAMSTASEITDGDRNTVPILCVAVAMGAGAFLPLGVWRQVRIAATAALAIVVGGLTLGGPLRGDPTAVALLGVAASVLAAREMASNRRRVDTSLTALQEAEARFQHLASSAATIFWWLGPSGDVRYVSPAFEKIWGLPISQAYRDWRLLLEIVHPEDRARARAALEDLTRHGFDDEFRIVRGDGSVRRIRTRAYPAEAMQAIAGMTEDVTEQRRTEDELRASQKRYAELVENAPDPVLTFDGRGRLLSANPAMERLLQRCADDLAGKYFLYAGVIAKSSRRAAAGIARALAANGAAPPTELELLRGGGECVAVESNQRVVRGAGESIEVEVILRDLTERRRAAEASRLRGLAAHLDSAREHRQQQLARRLHDDLAQPLTALGLSLGWLSCVLPSQLEEPKTRVREMETLVTSLIAMVRQTMSELRPPVLDDFGLAAAVHWEAHDFRARTGIECVTHIDTDEARYTGDHAVAVFRTLQEALADAAARNARHVRVDLDATDGTIVVRVEDNGKAVSMSSLPWDLVGMRERAHQLGGDFEVDSPAEGGVKIRLRMRRDPASG